jgi:hypothetical protein
MNSGRSIEYPLRMSRGRLFNHLLVLRSMEIYISDLFGFYWAGDRRGCPFELSTRSTAVSRRHPLRDILLDIRVISCHLSGDAFLGLDGLSGYSRTHSGSLAICEKLSAEQY